jgi:hypothetical protein
MRIGNSGNQRFGVPRLGSSFGMPKLGASMKQAQAWRSKMRAMRQSFESTSGALTNAILGAQDNLASAQSQLAVKIATSRMQADAQKRVNEKVDDVSKQLDNLKTDITA